MAMVEAAAPQTGLQRVKDKVAIVTGAGSGIGRAAALKLAQEGAKVCLVDLRNERTDKVRQDIEAFGGEVIAADVDVSDPRRVAAGIKAAVDKWQTIDIVFANAGINGVLAPIEDLSPEEWDHTISTNLKGTFLIVKYAIPYMKQNGGSIIITSSINGNRTFSMFGGAAYSTSKAGQVAFAKMAALEQAKYKIRVNAICPGGINTNIGQSTEKAPSLDQINIPVFYPQGSEPLEHKTGEPEQVAELVLFLACGESSHITGSEICIDGAESLL
ncbi:MAG TPA: SDR family NAD(P)-dependent oxidoreductase [Bacilli bacterium]